MTTRMIIDSHCHITKIPEPVWGWGPHFYVEELIEQMDSGVEVLGERTHVSKALVMGSLGLTTLTEYSPLEMHQYLIESLEKYPGRLFGNWVINPRHRLRETLDLIRKYVKEGPFRCMKLHPSMHNYWLPIETPSEGEGSRRMIYPIFELAEELDIPIMIHMGEPPYSVPATVWGVASAFPR
ncbi:MAG: amidohydrolase family protein, partial [Chloroflexi bacterium]|nr:amidohydrolase family protein [Chloroflexota bacterium]